MNQQKIVLPLYLLFIVLLSSCKYGEVNELREFDVDTPEVRIHVRMAGSTDKGCVLIAINGGPGLTSSYMWDLEQLAGDDCAVVTYDQRGLGKSTDPKHPDSQASYSLRKYAQDLEAIRQEIGDKAGMIPTLHNMAHIHLQNRQIEPALEKFVQALKLAQETQNAEGLFNVSRDLGNVLCQLGEKEQGLPLLQQALQVGRSMGHPGAGEVEALVREYS